MVQKRSVHDLTKQSQRQSISKAGKKVELTMCLNGCDDHRDVGFELVWTLPYYRAFGSRCG